MDRQTLLDRAVLVGVLAVLGALVGALVAGLFALVWWLI